MRGCRFYQEKGKKLTDKNDKKLSDIDIAIALTEIGGAVKSVQESVVRIESKMDTLPCDDLLERIVKLEKDRDSFSGSIKREVEHRDKLYGITRKQGGQIASLAQENRGQDKLSEKVWVLLGIGIGIAGSVVTVYLTRG